MSFELLTLDAYGALPRTDRTHLDTWLRRSGVNPTDVDAIKCANGTWSARYLIHNGTARSLRREWRTFHPPTPCPIEFPKETA